MGTINEITCCVCGVKVKRNHVLCRECFPLYRHYFKEQWFVELVHSQRIQDYIDSQECYSLGRVHVPITYKAPTRGGMKITVDTIRKAKEMRSKGLSLRKIGKELCLSYETIRKMVSNL